MSGLSGDEDGTDEGDAVAMSEVCGGGEEWGVGDWVGGGG